MPPRRGGLIDEPTTFERLVHRATQEHWAHARLSASAVNLAFTLASNSESVTVNGRPWSTKVYLVALECADILDRALSIHRLRRCI